MAAERAPATALRDAGLREGRAELAEWDARGRGGGRRCPGPGPAPPPIPAPPWPADPQGFPLALAPAAPAAGGLTAWRPLLGCRSPREWGAPL